jgi:hypothetical protein
MIDAEIAFLAVSRSKARFCSPWKPLDESRVAERAPAAR